MIRRNTELDGFNFMIVKFPTFFDGVLNTAYKVFYGNDLSGIFEDLYQKNPFIMVHSQHLIKDVETFGPLVEANIPSVQAEGYFDAYVLKDVNQYIDGTKKFEYDLDYTYVNYLYDQHLKDL